MWLVKTINYVFRDLITERRLKAFSVIKKSLPRFVTAAMINLVENYVKRIMQFTLRALRNRLFCRESLCLPAAFDNVKIHRGILDTESTVK